MSSESECVRRNTLYLAVRTRVVLISRSWVGTHGSGTLRLRDASSKRRIVKRKHRTRESSYKRAMLPENSYGDSTYHGHIVIASKYKARNNQLQKLRKMIFFSTLYRKSDLCFPINETARPRSQFLHSCICEEFINFQVRYAFLAASK